MKKRSGFTLIELVLTITILVVVIVAFYSMFTQGFTTVTNGGKKTVDAFQSQQIAELLYANSIADSPTPTPFPTDIVFSTPDETLTVNLNSPSSISVSGIKYSIDVSDKSIPIDIFIPNPS